MEELIGQTLGQYQIVEKIGEGGMSVVFKARQPGLERWVAVKVLPPHYAADPDFSRRFLREARAIAQLEHPHILPVYDFGQQGKYTYLVMRYIESSRTLTDVMDRPIPVKQAGEYLQQIAGALDYAHERGIIHRDVKPSNILLNKEWVFLADFGLARVMQEAAAQLTNTSVGSGTPIYMSPEQGTGAKIDARTDVYALGVIAYQMLTGQIPHLAETTQAIIYKRNHQPAPPLRDSRPDIPEPVDQVVQKALAANPAARFDTAGTFVATLLEAVQTSNASNLLTATMPASPAIPAEPAKAAPPERVLCANCGRAVPWGTPFCDHCGRSVETRRAVPPEEGRSSTHLWKLLAGLGILGLLVLVIAGATWVALRPTGEPEPGASPPTEPVVAPLPTTTAIDTLFSEQFEGVGLDRQRWTFTPGLGEIQAYQGTLRLTSRGQTFPLVYSNQLPFPTDSNFSLMITMRHISAGNRPTGFGLSAVPLPTDLNRVRGAFPQANILEIRQDDQSWRVLAGQARQEVYRHPAPDLERHQIEIKYVDNIYHLVVDGEQLYSSESTPVRPAGLWFGSPADLESAGAWSDLEISQVSLEALADSLVTIPPTATPSPSPTQTPQPPPATPTPVPLGQSCEQDVAELFADMWQAYRQQLGCPTSDLTIIPTLAEEAFQGGHLFWRSDTDRVYIVLDREKENGALFEGQWRPTPPEWRWDGSNPEGVGLSPPSGLVEPKRGFGWLWRTHLGGPEGPLGWALDREYGFDDVGRVQQFEEGLMFKGSGPKIYVLLDNGTFYARE